MNTLKRLCIKRGRRFVIVPRTWEPGKLGNWEPGKLGTRERKRNSYQAINLTVKHWKEHPYKREHFCLICG